jgi:hypothetical protein
VCDRDAPSRRRLRSIVFLLLPTLLPAFFTVRPNKPDPACAARGFVAFFAMVSREGIMPRSPGSSWGTSTGTSRWADDDDASQNRRERPPKGDSKRPACLSIHRLAIRTTTSDGSSGGPIDAIATTSATMLAQTMTRKMRSIGRQRPCDLGVPRGARGVKLSAWSTHGGFPTRAWLQL